MADVPAIAQALATGVTVAFVLWREYGKKHEPPPANGGSVTVTLPGPKASVDLEELQSAVEVLKRAAVQNKRDIAQNKRDIDADMDQIRTDMTDFSGEVAERILKLTAKIRSSRGIPPT